MSFGQTFIPERGGEGHGGDGIALDFKNYANQIFVSLDSGSLKSKFEEIDRKLFFKKQKEMYVRSVETALYDEKNNKKDAISYPGTPGIVMIDSAKWQVLTNIQKVRLVFHEVLVLLTLEGSDDYHISSQLTSDDASKTSLTYKIIRDYSRVLWKECGKEFISFNYEKYTNVIFDRFKVSNQELGTYEIKDISNMKVKDFFRSNFKQDIELLCNISRNANDSIDQERIEQEVTLFAFWEYTASIGYPETKVKLFAKKSVRDRSKAKNFKVFNSTFKELY